MGPTEEIDGVAFPAVQMRLGFGAPTGPTKMHLTLAGLTVLVEATDGRWDETWQHLNAVGIRARPHEGGGLAFGVGELSKAATMPNLVKVRTDRALEPLWRLSCSPPESESVAQLEMLGGSLRLRWSADDGVHDLECPPQSHAALLAGEVPFVASPDAWMTLRANTPLPAVAGRASLHTDRYIELTTSKPQLIEGAPLPALFKLADSRYGVPLSYWERVRATGGILWDGPTPTTPGGDVMTGIEWRGGAILVGTPGECDAALDRIVDDGEHGPILIVTTPWSLWRWQTADGWVRSYDQVAEKGAPGDASLIYFDGLDDAARCGVNIEAALRRLDGVRDAVRLAGLRERPRADLDGMLVGAAVKPAEFLAGEPIVLRYPGRGVERLGEHLDPYCLDAADVASQDGPTAAVRRIAVSGAAALGMARSRVSGDSREMWAQTDRELGAVGGAWFVGALDAVGEHRGRRVVVCCHDKTLASGIAAGLRPRQVSVVDEDDVGVSSLSDCTVLRYSTGLPAPEHRMWERFDVIVVCGSKTGLGTLRDHLEFGRDVELVLGAETPDEERARYGAGVAGTRRLSDDELDDVIISATWPDPRGVEDGW